MKTLIVYVSYHHKNTEKIAQAIGSVLNAKMINPSQITEKEIEKADLIGFGSGVYYGKFHKELIELMEKLKAKKDKKAFLFSTSGVRKNIFLNRSHSHFKKILKKKRFQVIGEFNCKGFDTFGFLRLIGGVNKGRPGKKDIEKSKEFAKSLIDQI